MQLLARWTLQKEDPEFVDKFLKSLYVDDLSSGAADQDGAYDIYIPISTQVSWRRFHFTKIRKQLRYLTRKDWR